ncbi:MAG: FmdB family zinc ribbon protein [Actinomycetota bacterium]|jgi:putative FmdB family regulatory protein
MPTYEYRCKKCGQHLEVVQSFSDEPLKVCPNCKGMLQKVFSPVGIVFKGSGFYKTDNRSGKGGAHKHTEKETSSTSSSSSSSSSDSTSSSSGSAKTDSKIA